MGEYLLSVVIPAYNAEKFIGDCLEAVTHQTYSNIEIIVVDDGSSDNTVAIANEFASRDPRVKVLTHENKGVSFTRNEGIAFANGDYICFFDADDYPEPDLIESYIADIELWKDKDVSFVMCGMYFDNLYNKNVRNKKHILETARGYIEGESYLLNRSSAAMLAWLKIFNFVTNKCYNLKKIKECGIHFDEGIHIGEDLKFNLDYLDHCPGNVGMRNKPLYHYVKRSDGSLSISYHGNDLADTKCVYKRFINWEASQPEVTDDNVLVIKGIFINDWVNRLTAYYEKYRKDEDAKITKYKIKTEIKSSEFQNMLKDTRKAKKISLLRYMCLRTGIYELFYLFRSFYQVIKG